MALAIGLVESKKLLSELFFAFKETDIAPPFWREHAAWLKENWTGVGLRFGELGTADNGVEITMYCAVPPPPGLDLEIDWPADIPLLAVAEAILPSSVPRFRLRVAIDGQFQPLGGGPAVAGAGAIFTGDSIGTEFHDVDTGQTFGTLGALLRLDANPLHRYILSNNHILALNGDIFGGTEANANIISPAAPGVPTGAPQVIAVMENPLDVVVRLQRMPFRNMGDFAVARLLAGTTVGRASPPGMPAVSVRRPIDPAGNMRVFKHGSRTGVTSGIIKDPLFDFALHYRSMRRLFLYSDQFLIESDVPERPFATEGDSGSLVVSSNGEPVGIVVGKNLNDVVASPINGFCNALGMSFVLPGD